MDSRTSKDAMKERGQELKAAARRGPRAHKADGESDVLANVRLAGAGYSSSIERERRRGRVQFSTVSPLTRPNSAVLFVTSLSPRLRV